VRKVFSKRKNRTALIDGCVIYNGVVQPCLMRVCRVRGTFHVYFERHFRAVHYGILAHVFVISTYRSTAFFSRHACLQSEVANTPTLCN